MPPSVDVPENVTVPAVAVSEPVTETFDETEKFRVVVMEPLTFNDEKVRLPLPPIVFEDPDRVTVPDAAVNEPVTVISLVTAKEAEVLIALPDAMVNLLKMMPLPLIDPVAELMVNVPVPPDVWVNVPEPAVEKLPAADIFVDAPAVIPEPEIVSVLKLYVPFPVREELFPLNVIVLVFPVNVPLLTRLLLNVCENVEALNVVPEPIESTPVTVIAAPACSVTVPEVLRFPITEIAPVVDFVPLPLNDKLP